MAGRTAPPANSKPAMEAKLYVRNLPIDLEKECIKSIFQEFGKVTGVLSPPHTTFACVSFSKWEEAEAAIIGLHDKPPLKLKVELTKDNLTEPNDTSHVRLMEAPDFRYQEVPLPKMGKQAINMGMSRHVVPFRPDAHLRNNELLYPIHDDACMFNPYEISDSFHETNLMYSKGALLQSVDGRRMVKLGRGYTYYNLPEPHYRTPVYLHQNVYKRMMGEFEYCDDALENESGPCIVCNVICTSTCQNCGTFYCSKACQKGDWIKHKPNCEPVPGLVKLKIVKEQEPETVKNVNNAQTNNCPRRPKIASSPPAKSSPSAPTAGSVTKSKPNTSTVISPNKENVPVKKLENLSNIDKLVSLKTETNGIQSRPTQNRPRSENHMTSSKDSEPIRAPRENKVDNKVESKKIVEDKVEKKVENKQVDVKKVTVKNNIIFQENIFLPKDKFVEVSITYSLGNNEYSVQKIEDAVTFNKFQTKLAELSTKKPFVQPQLMRAYAIKLQEGWYRATVTSIDPIICFFDDIGFSDEVDNVKFCELDDLEDTPKFSKKIRIVEDSDKKYANLEPDMKIFVKALTYNSDGSVNVQVQEKKEVKINGVVTTPIKSKESTVIESKDPAPSNAGNDTLKTLQNILDLCKKGSEGTLILSSYLGPKEWTVSFIENGRFTEFASLIEEFQNACNAIPVDPTFKPKLGDLICGFLEKGPLPGWYRGVVVTQTPILQIAVVDEGRVEEPAKVLPIIPKYAKIPSFGVTCKFDRLVELKKDDTFNFQITEKSENSAKLILKNCNGKEETVSVEKWTHIKPEQKGIANAELKSGKEVFISHFVDQNILYVQSLDDKDKNFNLLQKVAKHAVKNAKKLDHAPIVGEIVMAKFSEDKNYYRAIVTKIQDAKVIIKYIDFGNDETTTVDQLFELPDDLKEHPSCAAKISLKDVPKDVSLTTDATSYLADLVLEAVPLVCSFEGKFNGEVELKTLKNESVNQKIAHLIKPHYERHDPEKETTTIMLGDIRPSKLGEVGETVDAILLGSLNPNKTFFFCPRNEELILHLQGVMPEQIANYVKTAKSHYIPRTDEHCIAKYEDAYYRGLCLVSSQTPTTASILFIDYGNISEVKHTDIYLMPADFVPFEQLSVVCDMDELIPGIENKPNPDELLAKLEQIMVVNEIYQIKIIAIDPEGDYKVDIPDVRQKIRAAKLV